MSGGTTARKVNVNVSGRSSLSVVATNGIYLAPSWTVYNDHADWVNPILTCAK
jgi:hypothetical protein